MKLLSLILVLLFVSSSFTQEEDNTANEETMSVQQRIRSQTEIDDPFSLRDPFRSSLIPQSQMRKDDDPKKRDLTPETVDLNLLSVVGVLVGPQKRAFGKVGNQTIILKEGMRLGPEQVELKAILPGGIVLVEKITNVYGQEEYLETIIPISK